MSLSIAAALLLGCGVSASSMTYYSRRYVGELALLTGNPQRPLLRISVLDFWGHRQARQSASIISLSGNTEFLEITIERAVSAR